MTSRLPSVTSIALFVGIGFVFFVLLLIQRHRREQAWRAFAERHGLHFEMDPLLIEGTCGNQPLSLFTERRRQGDDSHTVTVFRLDVRHALPPKLSLWTEGLGSKVLKMLGASDQEVGDPQFDAAFGLANLSSRARDVLLAPDVREQLLRLKQDAENVSVEAGVLQVEWRGESGSVESLEQRLAAVLDATDALDAAARHLHQTG